MENANTEIDATHGLDASPSDATASATINEVETSARALKGLAGRNLGQIQTLEVTRSQRVDGNTRRNGGSKNNTMSNTKSFMEGFAVICDQEKMAVVESTFEHAIKLPLLFELSDIAGGLYEPIEATLKDINYEDIQYENLPEGTDHEHFRRRYLADDLYRALGDFLEAKFIDFLLDKRGHLSRIFHPKRKDPNGLLIVKAKLDLATGRVLDVQFYNPINRVWGDPQEPNANIRDLFEGLEGEDLQEVRKKRLAKWAKKRQ